MTQRPGKARSGARRGWMVAVAVVSLLAVAVAGYRMVQMLRHDDCTVATNPMPDGSHITITTCS
ncbi:MAG: hypothetical protein ACXW3K_08520 [Brevundimonas sp.]